MGRLPQNARREIRGSFYKILASYLRACWYGFPIRLGESHMVEPKVSRGGPAVCMLRWEEIVPRHNLSAILV